MAADFNALPLAAQRAALAVLLDAAHDMRSDGDPATVEALESLAAMAAPVAAAAADPPSPPPGFTGVRHRILAAAQDGPHHVTLAVYRFPPGDGDPPGPIDVPYVELHETHNGARPGRVMALSALVHLCQNASDDEVWAIGGRETPGPPGVDEAASLAREAVEGWAAAARCEEACQHGHECAPSAELVAHLDALTGGAERATVGAMASPHDPPPTKDLPTLLAEIETAAQEAMRLHPHALHLAAVVALCLDARRATRCGVGPPVAPHAT